MFPGVGSPFGSILPGVVLQSVALLDANNRPGGEAPSVYTVAPSYLPDAPFINRGYADSSFNKFDVGIKWRLTDINKPIGFGFVAAYTYYMDTANDPGGFNQMQRGAGPGAPLGDISVTMFADSRVAPWANISANFGYKYTSASKADFPGGTFTLLDRPDELQIGRAHV